MACPSPGSSSLGSPTLLSLFPFPTEQLVKKNLRKEKKEKKKKKSHHHEWVTNTAGKIHGEQWWNGVPPSLASQQPVSYLHCSQTLCTAQSERGAPPQKQQCLLLHLPAPHPRVGRGQVREGRKRQRLMRMSVGETEAEASREI